MANFCINHADHLYQILYDMTGLCEAELDALIRPYLEKYGEFPTVDIFLRNSSTEEYLAEKYNLKKDNGYYVSDKDLDLVEINNIFRDLEVKVEKMANGQSLVTVKKRALPNRKLEREYAKILPTAKSNTLEIPAVWTDGKTFIYELLGNYYKTNLRIASNNFLVAYPSFPSLLEAINSQIQIDNILNSDVLHTVLNSKSLLHGDEITIYSDTKLPPQITLFEDFTYPNFIIDDNVDKYEIINDVIHINSNLVTSNLEENLLKAAGYQDFRINDILINLENPITFNTVYIGNNSYAIKLDKSIPFSSINFATIKPKSSENNIELLLDRLEEYYGIKFNRVTTELLREDNFISIIPNALSTNAFILNGEIYINIDNSRSDAPIHELSHIIVGSLRQTNPELYALVVNSVEQLPDYQRRLIRYPNRTRMDANEEIFVDLFAKHFVSGIDINTDNTLLEKLEYQAKRNIDSAIFPYESTTTESLSDLMGQSFELIMEVFGTSLLKDNMIQIFKKDLGVTTRYMANIKLILLENGSLKEYCE